MKRYRIVKNEKDVYRVQRRIRLGIAKVWVFEKYYEVNDTYPKVISHPVEFKSDKEAKLYIEEKMEKVIDHKKWQVVKSFSDNKPVS